MLKDNTLINQFNAEPTYRPQGLADILGFIKNADKSMDNANKLATKLDTSLSKSKSYIIAGGILIGAFLLTQSIKNIQEIQSNIK